MLPSPGNAENQLSLVTGHEKVIGYSSKERPKNPLAGTYMGAFFTPSLRSMGVSPLVNVLILRRAVLRVNPQMCWKVARLMLRWSLKYSFRMPWISMSENSRE